MKEGLGDRMKNNYENRFRFSLVRRTFTIIRIDGKSFQTYTKGLKKPFDDGLMEDMDEAAKELCTQISGTKFAYIQSDEISLLITDFEELSTQSWFDNSLQKMCSISASIASSAFNLARVKRLIKETTLDHFTGLKIKSANFDSRVFQIPERAEVFNYFLSRQRDATKNSISSVAETLYSTNELHKKTGDQKQEMIFQKGINWNNYAPRYKRGRVILKEQFLKNGATRFKWIMKEPPIFSQEKDFLLNLIPINNQIF